MHRLVEKIDSVLSNIGNPTLEHPIFYNSPVAIRFEIVWADSDNDKSYFDNAVNRLVHIYNHSAFNPDIMMIEYIENDLVSKQSVIEICKSIGLDDYVEKADKVEQDGEIITKHHLYWNIYKVDFNYKKLFFEIVNADFGGNKGFVSSVFLFDTDNNIVFHPYDDRGADLIAANKETIKCFYVDFNNWILDYDREQIDKLFQDEN